MKQLIAIIQSTAMPNNNYWFLIGIQIFLLAFFIFMVSYLCRILKKDETKSSTKKTCLLIWLLSAIAWLIISQIVWVITSIQTTGG